MDDKHLSGEEKRKRMKEEFKKDLEMRRNFLDKVKNLRQQQGINRALSNMLPEDDTQDWIDKLNSETAFLEAKSEIAVDASGDSEKHDFVKQEQELEKAVAESMVEKMKRDLLEESKIETSHEYQKENGDEPSGDAPKKTLGDF